MEDVRNKSKMKLIKQDQNEKIIKKQSKLNFNGIHKP